MKRSKKNLFRGLAGVSGALLALSTIAQLIAHEYRSYMDDFFHTTSTKIVKVEGTGSEDKYNFKSSYKTAEELAKADKAYGEKVTGEGAVLLKNKNNAKIPHPIK